MLDIFYLSTIRTARKIRKNGFPISDSMVKFQTNMPRNSIWHAASPAQENFRDLPTGRHPKLEGHPARQENLRKGHSDFGLQENFRDSHSRRNRRLEFHDGIPNEGLTFSIFLPSGTPGKFGRMVFKFPNSMVKFQASVPRISIWRAASPAQENFRDLPTGRNRKLEAIRRARKI